MTDGLPDMKRIIALVFSAFLAFAATAQEAPDALVKRVADEVLTVLRTDKELQSGNTRRAIELVEQKVLPNFNFTRMTRLALGKEWNKATPEQQQKLTAEFKTMLVRTYSNALTGYKNQALRYKTFKMNPGDKEVVVQSEIVRPGAPLLPIDYSLEKLDGGWKVYDVVVDGISLVVSYRDQFSQEVRINGVDGLIKALAAKNKTFEVSKADKK